LSVVKRVIAVVTFLGLALIFALRTNVDHRPSEVSVTTEPQVAMPAPSWLPDGWTRLAQGDRQSWYGPSSSGPRLSVELSDDPNEMQRFRGGSINAVTDIQGRSAVWVTNSDGLAAVPVLILHDDHWTLIVYDTDRSVKRDVIEEIASSLRPLPFPASIPTPTVQPRGR
jgi:hypothetical protein